MNEIEKICEIKDQFDKIYVAHPEELDGYTEICDEMRIQNSKQILADYNNEVNIDKNRLLRIGFVGRVKAGKSSVINAFVFDGKDILPKAATPMTAALTEISYGEKLKVTVDFFEQSDIDSLKAKHSEYLAKFNEEKNIKLEELKKKARYTPSEMEEKARKSAKNLITETNPILSGSFEQYELILKKKVTPPTESKVFYPNNLDEIATVMYDYVGENGQFMPLTRSVKLEIPIDFLHDVTIVDTPGFNDPVPSRDKRAIESLRECDVIFILSPASQFLSAEDTKVIEKIRNKEGIREIYALASKADSELLGSEKDNNNGILDKVLDSLTKGYTTNLNNNNVIKNLIADHKEVILNSGMAYSMYKSFDNKANWNEDLSYQWNLLKENYPDSFSDIDQKTSKEQLKKLANMDILFDKIENVKGRKGEIFQNKIKDFIDAKKNAINQLAQNLYDKIDAHEKKVDGLSFEELQQNVEQLEQNQSFLKSGIKMAVEQTVNKWQEEQMSRVQNELNAANEQARLDLQNVSYEKTETKTGYHIRETGWWIFKKTHYDPYEYQETSTHYNTNQMNVAYDTMSNFVENLFYTPVICANILKHKMASTICQKWTEKAANSIFDKDEISSIVFSLVGEVSNKAADDAQNDIKDVFIHAEYSDDSKSYDKVYEDIKTVRSRAKSVFNDYLDYVSDKLIKSNLSEKLLQKIGNELETLKRDLNNKKEMKERNSRIKGEINEIDRKIKESFI